MLQLSFSPYNNEVVWHPFSPPLLHEKCSNIYFVKYRLSNYLFKKIRMSFLSPTMQYTLTLLPFCGRVFITVCKVVLTLKDTRLAIRKTFSRVKLWRAQEAKRGKALFCSINDF